MTFLPAALPSLDFVAIADCIGRVDVDSMLDTSFDLPGKVAAPIAPGHTRQPRGSLGPPDSTEVACHCHLVAATCWKFRWKQLWQRSKESGGCG